MTRVLEDSTVAAPESERLALTRVQALLDSFTRAARSHANSNGDTWIGEQHDHTMKLVNSSGETADLPESLVVALRQLVSYLARGQAVSLVPVLQELTTQE